MIIKIEEQNYEEEEEENTKERSICLSS